MKLSSWFYETRYVLLTIVVMLGMMLSLDHAWYKKKLYALDDHIVKHDWSLISSGEFVINSLALDDQGNLYAGGRIQSIGEQEFHHIGMWDGDQWHDLGARIEEENPVLDIRLVRQIEICQDGNIFACIEFYSHQEETKPRSLFEGIVFFDRQKQKWSCMKIPFVFYGDFVIDPQNNVCLLPHGIQRGMVPHGKKLRTPIQQGSEET